MVRSRPAVLMLPLLPWYFTTLSSYSPFSPILTRPHPFLTVLSRLLAVPAHSAASWAGAGYKHVLIDRDAWSRVTTVMGQLMREYIIEKKQNRRAEVTLK